MKSGTDLAFCPLCSEVVWKAEPLELRMEDGAVIARYSPMHFPELQERQAVQHYEQAHPRRWRLSQRQFVARRPWLFNLVLTARNPL